MNPALFGPLAYYINTGKMDNDYLNESLFDRKTALEVLKDLSKDMYPSHDLFGKPTLVINRDKFENVRKKYLDK